MQQIHGGLGNCPQSSAIKFTPGFRTERSRDLLTTPEAVTDFAKHLESTNRQRHREQERRRKLGLVEAVA